MKKRQVFGLERKSVAGSMIHRTPPRLANVQTDGEIDRCEKRRITDAECIDWGPPSEARKSRILGTFARGALESTVSHRELPC